VWLLFKLHCDARADREIQEALRVRTYVHKTFRQTFRHLDRQAFRLDRHLDRQAFRLDIETLRQTYLHRSARALSSLPLHLSSPPLSSSLLFSPPLFDLPGAESDGRRRIRNGDGRGRGCGHDAVPNDASYSRISPRFNSGRPRGRKRPFSTLPCDAGTEGDG
jgi:hypothetical protein